jgi:hypothetical protein
MPVAPGQIAPILLLVLVLYSRERTEAIFIQKDFQEMFRARALISSVYDIFLPKAFTADRIAGQIPYSKIISDGETKKSQSAPSAFLGFLSNGEKETRNSLSVFDHDHEDYHLAIENSFVTDISSSRISAEVRFDSDIITIFIWKQNTVFDGNVLESSES